MLIIDNREAKLIELIKNTQLFTIPYEIKSLQIGDIIISNDKYPDKSIIIERKCVQDMLASIKDGRYKEQKIRLQAEKFQSNGNKLICYLIEGSSQDVRYPNEKKVFHGSLISSIFRDDIPLIRSMSLSETLDIIIRMNDRLNKDITDFFKPIIKQTIVSIPESKIETNLESVAESVLAPIAESLLKTNINQNENDIEKEKDIEKEEEEAIKTITNENNIESEIPSISNSYLNSIKKCKKDNLTPKLWNQISLTNIPGVSTNIATKISEVYPSLKLLFQAYDKCETDDSRIKLISEIILTNNGKTKRRIGEVVSKRILEYLYKDLDILQN
jgi:ERCC4-type nuclease